MPFSRPAVLTSFLLALFLVLPYPFAVPLEAAVGNTMQLAKGAGEESVLGACTLLVDRDSRVAEKNPNTNYGSSGLIHIGPETAVESDDVRRIYLGADLGANCTETGQPLDPGVTIESAYLRLYTNNGPGLGLSHSLTRVAEAGVWAEGTITWNNQPPVESVPTDTVWVSHKNRWLNEWDVTTDVLLFRAGTPNNGWRLAPTNENYTMDGRRSEYLSREYSSHTDSALGHPRLQIFYRTTVLRSSISDTAVLRPNPTLDRFTVSGQCESGVDVYQMPWGRNKLLVGKDLAGQISLRAISDSLLFLDHADARFVELFGYAYTQDVPGREPEVRVCSEIGNAGTDNRGIGMPSSLYLGGSQDDERELRATVLTTLAHERIHTWQHRRGSLFMQADDGGHAQLVGLEPGFYALAAQGFLGSEPMPPELQSFAIHHAALDRYFADPTRDWDTFFSAAGLAAFGAGTAPLTDDADRQLIYSGILEWLRRVHGEAGLAAFHAEVDALRIAAGWTDLTDLPNRTATQRNALFLEALIGGLGVDAATYFDHWKMPVSAGLRTYSEGFPTAPGTLDADNDTFTPLEGDFDDSDSSRFPRAPELIDGKDNNFDGQVDESVIEDSVGSDLSATPADNPISLPLAVFGEIHDLADVDGLQFELPSRSLVTVILRAVDSDSTVIEGGSGKEVTTFVGRVQLDGAVIGRPNIVQLQHVVLSEVLGAGPHTLTVSASAYGNVPANPGEYVLQAFVNDFESPGMSGVEGAARFDYRLANLPSPKASFSCVDARNASQAECRVLVDAFEHLGGEDWLDIRGWLDTEDVCSWKGVRCDDAGIDRLLLDSGEGRAPVGTLDRFDWSALSASISVLELDGSAVGGALPTEFGTFALEVLRFDPSGDLCVPTSLRTWFDAIPSKSGDLPDCCADDPDADGIFTCNDNCPLVGNALQEDGDSDGLGDACDACPADGANDVDGDGFCADVDNCPLIDNPSQTDSDADGAGNACDPCAFDALDDADGDGFCANVDNCPSDANPDQADGDGDSIGDACDACPNDALNDIDADGFCGDVDNCAMDANPDQSDADFDGVGDVCDLCEGDDATGDGDFDGICADRDCDDGDGEGISCGLFFDGFELGNTSLWDVATP